MKRDIRIDTDPDFVDSPKHNNSLKKLIADYPGGAPDRIIRRVLRLTQEEVEAVYLRAILKLRENLKDDDV
jgi:hypothetical protein